MGRGALRARTGIVAPAFGPFDRQTPCPEMAGANSGYDGLWLRLDFQVRKSSSKNCRLASLLLTLYLVPESPSQRLRQLLNLCWQQLLRFLPASRSSPSRRRYQTPSGKTLSGPVGPACTSSYSVHVPTAVAAFATGFPRYRLARHHRAERERSSVAYKTPRRRRLACLS